MRYLLTVILLACLASPVRAVSAEEIVEVAPIRAAWVIALRQGMLESAIGLAPRPFAMTRVTFGVPEEILPQLRHTFSGRAVPEINSYLISPRHYATLQRWHGDHPDSILVFLEAEPEFRELIDHEVGHTIAFDRARQTGEMGLYFTPNDSVEVAARILKEGIGTYFQGRLAAERAPMSWAILPSNWRDPNWYSDLGWQRIRYYGGHWIVRPIIDQYGERGLAYILAHPLHMPDGDAFTAGVEYQRTALEALSTTE